MIILRNSATVNCEDDYMGESLLLHQYWGNSITDVKCMDHFYSSVVYDTRLYLIATVSIHAVIKNYTAGQTII